MKFLLLMSILISFLLASKTIEIDLSKQKLYAKENGELLFSGDVSTGKDGHLTPKGIFKVIDKDRFHISNKYPEPNGGAKMYYMLRLTNSGLAIHKGYLPGYPASHGCVRVSKNTAIKLWRWANIGTRVKIYGNSQNYVYKRKRKVKKSYAKKYKKKRKYYTKKRVYAHKRYSKNRFYKRKKIYAKRKKYINDNRHYVKIAVPKYRVVELYDDY